MNLVSITTVLTAGGGVTDTLVNDILTPTSKNMTVMEEGQ